MEQQTVAIEVQEVRRRWERIVKALMEEGIEPDAITCAALTMGVQSLAGSFGTVDDAPPKRPIGFCPGRERK